MSKALEVLRETEIFLAEARSARSRQLLQARAQRLTSELSAAFQAQGDSLMERMEITRGQWGIANGQTVVPEWESLFDESAEQWRDSFVKPISSSVRFGLKLGGEELAQDLGMEGMFDLRHPLAEDYIAKHGADLVRGIDDTTKGYIRTVIKDGATEGWSYDRIAKSIIERYEDFAVGRPQQHIKSRAHMVEVTELGNAYEAGNFVTARALEDSGLTMEKSWLTVNDGRVCSEECELNQGQGWIPIDQPFQSGDMQPLAHPACRCVALYRRNRGA